MAKHAGPNTSMPVDQAVIARPGVHLVESEFFAMDGSTVERRGFVRDMLDARSPVGRANGNRSDGGGWMTPRPLTDGGPFTNLRGRNRSL